MLVKSNFWSFKVVFLWVKMVLYIQFVLFCKCISYCAYFVQGPDSGAIIIAVKNGFEIGFRNGFGFLTLRLKWM